MSNRQLVLRYFQFPNYWEPINEPISDAQHAVQRLCEIEAAYISTDGEYPCAYIEESATRSGDCLLIGLAKEYWMISIISNFGSDNCDYCYAIGDLNACGTVPFVVPEWTEISRKRLISRGAGMDIVRTWIESGKLLDAATWSYDI